MFARSGTYRYITLNRPDRRVWHDEGTTVTFDAAGRAMITAKFEARQEPFPKAGAHIVFFGVN